MANLQKVDIYKIIVAPCHSVSWNGLFNFKPNANDVAAAIRADINEFDENVEHEADIIQGLRQTLELVTFHTPELLGRVRIAGTDVGEISIAIVKVFGKEKPKPCGPEKLPEPHSKPLLPFNPHMFSDGNSCGEEPLSDLTNNGKVQSDQWHGVPEGIPSAELTLEQHISTDPRTGEVYPPLKTTEEDF